MDVRSIPENSELDLYIGPSCPYCHMAMEYYDRIRRPYTAHDAYGNADERARMFEFTDGDPTVPAIVVDGKHVQSGWGDPPRG